MGIFNDNKTVDMSQFVPKSDFDAMYRDHQIEIKAIEQEHEFEISELRQDHKLELKQKEYDITHFKDDELKKEREETIKLRGELAVAKKENEMLDRLVNVNADIVDVKDLIGKLIGKLPEVNLKELTIHTGTKSS